MNTSIFVQTEGYPLTADRLQELQTTFQPFNAFGGLAGNLTIISGCETEGTSINDGFVFINGELLQFKKASVAADSKVIIMEEKISRPFKNGISKDVYVIRYATFGTATTFWLWSEFKRPIQTKEISGVLASKADKTTTDQLETNKADETDLVALQNKVTTLENTLAALKVPKIIIDSDRRTVNSSQGGNNYDNLTKNCIYVYPPSGYTMSNLAGFLASISQIKFAGDVDDNDGVWCKYATDGSKITVICGAPEMREASQVSYMAVWIKY